MHIGGGVRRIVAAGSGAFCVLLVAVCLIFAGVLAWALLDRAKGDTRSMVVALQQYALRTFEVSGLVADEVVALVEARGGIGGLAADRLAHEQVRAMSDKLPGLSNIIVVDAAGRVILDSNQYPAAPVDLSDRSWFKAHIGEGKDHYIGHAIHSRVINQLIYTYGRTLRGPDGATLGVVSLGIPAASVMSAGALPQYAEGVSLSLYRKEGLLVARNPFPPELVERHLPLPEAALVDGEGSLYRRRPSDGRYSVSTFKALPDLDLVAMASIPVVTVLRPLGYAVAFGLPVLVAVIAGILALRRTALRSLDQNQLTMERLEQALDDNRVLFREVHHRVKNNLQMIASLLQQQARRSDPKVRLVLGDAIGRVHSIALVHDQIYARGNPSSIDLATYLDQLVRQVAISLKGSREVTVELDLAPVSVSLDRAVPIAMVAAEVVTNCYKHAFGDGPGRIRLRLAAAGALTRLTIQDDGRGLPGSRSGGTLGMTIIDALTRQVCGRSGFESQSGTLFWLEWPTEEPARVPVFQLRRAGTAERSDGHRQQA